MGGDSNWVEESIVLDGTRSLKEIDVFEEVGRLVEEWEVVEQEDPDFNGAWRLASANKVYVLLS